MVFIPYNLYILSPYINPLPLTQNFQHFYIIKKLSFKTLISFYLIFKPVLQMRMPLKGLEVYLGYKFVPKL